MSSEVIPSVWLLRWYAAQALTLLERVPEAVTANRDVVERNPGAWFAWVALGQLYSRQQDRTRAIEAYERALELNPGDQVARDDLTRLRES